MAKHLKLFCILLSVLIVSVSVFLVPGNAVYNDIAYESYINMSQDSSVPSLFRNDTVFAQYREFPPVISDGIEYVPLELFSGLSGVKINFSDDGSNFYIQNKNINKYISFSINGEYALTDANKVYQVKVPAYYGTHYVPLRIVCQSTGIGCDSYNDGENKIYVIKVFVNPGLSAKELIKIHAPGVYGNINQEQQNSDEQDTGNNQQEQTPADETFGRRTIHIAFTGKGLENTRRILDSLAAYRIKAAFFVTREDILAYPDSVRSIYTSGHTIGITFSQTADVLVQENSLEENIKSTEDALYDVLKTRTRLVYLPEISAVQYRDNDIKKRITALGLKEVGFNLDVKPDIIGYYNASAAATDGIKNLQATRRTTYAFVKLSMSENSRFVFLDLAELGTKYKDISFSRITEIM